MAIKTADQVMLERAQHEKAVANSESITERRIANLMAFWILSFQLKSAEEVANSFGKKRTRKDFYFGGAELATRLFTMFIPNHKRWDRTTRICSIAIEIIENSEQFKKFRSKLEGHGYTVLWGVRHIPFTSYHVPELTVSADN